MVASSVLKYLLSTYYVPGTMIDIVRKNRKKKKERKKEGHERKEREREKKKEQILSVMI